MGAKYDEAQKKASLKYLSEKTDNLKIPYLFIFVFAPKI